MAQNGEMDLNTEIKTEPMEQGSGDHEALVPAEAPENGTHSDDWHKLVEYGIHQKVASELEIIYKTGLLTHGDLDERALDALKEFTAEGGIAVLREFKDSNLKHVGNKSAYLCGVIKTYRHKNKLLAGPDIIPRRGPDEVKIKEILERTGYTLDVTTGQRKYGGPPPNMDAASQPGPGHEVFCGKVPKDVFEDLLIPLFEKCGTIWDLRLMMDPLTGLNRGYCFVTFIEKNAAQEAVKQLDSFEIRAGKKLKLNVSVANLRLFVGNIPKSKSKDEIVEEFKKLTDGIMDVIIYSSPDDSKKKNRGFAFLEYDSHKSASIAKRRIGNGRTKVWGCDIIVDWADPQEEPDNDTMSKVKVLYVRNLRAEVTEEELQEKFAPYGKIDRVKKIKDYGFVHFEERDSAVQALADLNGQKLGDIEMEISLAKPPSENKQKERRKRDQNFRMGRGFGFDDFWGPPPPGMMGGPMRGRGRMMRPPHMGGGGRGGGGGFMRDYDYDYYGGFNSYRGGYADDYFDYYGGGGGYEDMDGGYYGGGYGPPRGRGGRGGALPPPSHPPARGRGGPHGRPSRGHAGDRGMRGPRGARGGFRGMSGRGAPRGGGPAIGGRGAARGGGAAASSAAATAAAAAAGKRKAPDANQAAQVKKRNTDGGSSSAESGWGAQPIAQQPLEESQWYQDNFSEQW